MGIKRRFCIHHICSLDLLNRRGAAGAVLAQQKSSWLCCKDVNTDVPPIFLLLYISNKYFHRDWVCLFVELSPLDQSKNGPFTFSLGVSMKTFYYSTYLFKEVAKVLNDSQVEI